MNESLSEDVAQTAALIMLDVMIDWKGPMDVNRCEVAAMCADAALVIETNAPENWDDAEVPYLEQVAYHAGCILTELKGA